jgi:hypothetical protein
MKSEYDKSYKPNYPQPYNIRVSPDLAFPNSALEDHLILKGHVAAKHEAKRKAQQQQERYYMGFD